MSAPHEPRVIDTVAWCQMVDAANAASLLVVIRAKLGPRLLATYTPEDVLQESLLQAWRDRAGATFETAASFRAWLLTIIDHRIRDLAEHDSAKKRGGGQSPARMNDAPEPSGSTTPSRLAIFREQAAAMIDALERVPTDCREVVRLRLFHQMPLAMIADQLQLGLGAVRFRFRAGAAVYREHLRDALISRSFPPGHGSAAPPTGPSASTI